MISFPLLKDNFPCRLETEADLERHKFDYRIIVIVQVRDGDDAELDLRGVVDTGISILSEQSFGIFI